MWSWSLWGCPQWTWCPQLDPQRWVASRSIRTGASFAPRCHWGGKQQSRGWRWPCRWPAAELASPTPLWTGCSGGWSTCGCEAFGACTLAEHQHPKRGPGRENGPFTSSFSIKSTFKLDLQAAELAHFPQKCILLVFFSRNIIKHAIWQTLVGLLQ